MIALDGDAGNACCLQSLQSGHGLVERQGVDGPLVEEIARQDDKVDPLCDGSIDDGEKGTGKIIAAFRAVVLFVAEMNVGTVKKSSFHWRLPGWSGGSVGGWLISCFACRLRMVNSVRVTLNPFASAASMACVWSVESSSVTGSRG